MAREEAVNKSNLVSLLEKNKSKICFANFDLVTLLCGVDSIHVYVKIFIVKPFTIVQNMQSNLS